MRRGLFLDLDGTLADSLEVMQCAYRRFLSEFQKVASLDEFASLNGPPLVDVVAQLKAAHGLPNTVSDLAARYRELVDDIYLDVEPVSGAIDLLMAARKAGWCSAIVTSNDAWRTKAWLSHVNLAALVDYVVSAEDLRRGKPHPDPYLRAIELSGCHAEDSIAIEDSLLGAQAAQAAGLVTYGLEISRDDPITWPAKVVPIRDLRTLIDAVFGGR